MLKDSGDIDELEWQAYQKWNNFFSDYFGKQVKTYHIYLRSDPEISYERIKKRHREEEEIIPFDYIQSLHKYHEDWLMTKNDNVLILDVNKDFIEDTEYQFLLYDKMCSTIFSKVI
jgi:deoxyadenosine/deoxycytidine kinase